MRRLLAIAIFLISPCTFAFDTGKTSVSVVGADQFARYLSHELTVRGYELIRTEDQPDYIVEILDARARSGAIASVGFPIARNAGVDATIMTTNAVASIRVLDRQDHEITTFDVSSSGVAVAPSIGFGTRHLFVEILGPFYERSRHRTIARDAALKIDKVIHGE